LGYRLYQLWHRWEGLSLDIDSISKRIILYNGLRDDLVDHLIDSIPNVEGAALLRERIPLL